MTNVEPLRVKSILLICAQDAFDAQMNRNFHARLKEAGIAHTFLEVPGAHDSATVHATLPAMFEFLAAQLTRPTFK